MQLCTRGDDEVLAVLVAAGIIPAERIEEVTQSIADTGTTAVRAIVDAGIASERTVTQTLSAKAAVRLLSEEELGAGLRLDNVSVEFLLNHNVVPISGIDGALLLATANPFNMAAVQSFERLGGYRVELRMGMPSQIERIIERVYESAHSAIGVEAVDELDTERLKDRASEAPVVRIVESLLVRAVDMGASDIHVESGDNKVSVRLRVDGRLMSVEAPPFRHAAGIFSRLKILSRLDIAERRLPQDGRIRHVIRGRTVDFRVSIIPSLHGERAVLRVLDRSDTPSSLADIGFSERIAAGIRRLLARPNGMLLVTGATGSGKTTTLYSALRSLPSGYSNILTVEDPVEYQIPGVHQVQVRPEIGLDFPTVLRSMLRQDPDTIMVGEIRDSVTAELAVQAALTGHLVLSTLHTNSAVGAFPRLLDMGVPAFLVATATEGIVAQRLLRRLCSACKTPLRVTPSRISLNGLPVALSQDLPIFQPMGCSQCNGTGYRGRVAIAELLEMDDEIRKWAMQDRSAQPLAEKACASGKLTRIEYDAVQKMQEGITSMEDTLSAFGVNP